MKIINDESHVSECVFCYEDKGPLAIQDDGTICLACARAAVELLEGAEAKVMTGGEG